MTRRVGKQSTGICHARPHEAYNNPRRIYFTDGSQTRYKYSATGEKLFVEHYVGSLTLRNGRIDKYQFEEGYCQASAYSGNTSQDNFTFHYYDRDHLGNICQVINAIDSTKGTVIQTMDYYPFGAQFCDGSTDSEVQSRKYNFSIEREKRKLVCFSEREKNRPKVNGKELDKMHGLNTYDYGARQYNPVTARWDRVDPLCEKYYNISPYAYCGGNPVMHIDPDGRKILPVLYRENNKDLLMPKYYRSMSSFVNAMEEFGKTTWGRHLISSFVDKGKSHYGVRGNGEYSDITLIIKEFNLNNSVLQTAKMMGNWVKIAGSLHARKND